MLSSSGPGPADDSGYIGSPHPQQQQQHQKTSSEDSGGGDPTEHQKLLQAEWFWEGCSREEALEKLLEATPTNQEGAFLVRPASTSRPGDKQASYTLTVRHAQTAKLLRISQNSSGKFGLVEPFNFPSVVALIDYYRENSLAEYNNSLDVKLLYPISRFADKFEEEESLTKPEDTQKKMLHMLEEISRDFLVKSRYLELHNQEYNKTMAEIHLKKQAVEAFNSALEFFHNQILLHKQLQQTTTTATTTQETGEFLDSNYQYLHHRMEEMTASKEQLSHSLQLQSCYARLTMNELNSVKPEIVGKRKERGRLSRRLEQLQTPLEEIEAALSPPKATIMDIWNEKLWYKPDASREEAQKLLKDTPEGTFLVRTSKGGELALSLQLQNGVVGHCIIYECPVGYGFTRNMTYFPSPRALVLFYSKHSLAEFNPHLTTCLRRPVFWA